MVSTKQEIFEKRRRWVNGEFGDLTRGKSLNRSKQNKLLRKLWKKAKREIK